MTLGYQTRAEMVSEIRGLIQNQATVKEPVIKASLNRNYLEAIGGHDWPQLEKHSPVGIRKADNATLKWLESGDGEVPLPPEVESVTGITIISPSEIAMEEVSVLDLMRRYASRYTTTGEPLYWAKVGVTAQYAPIASSDTMTLKCDSSANNNIHTVRVRYRTNSQMVGQSTWEDVSGVFSGSGQDLGKASAAGYSIEQIQIPAGWAGTLTITDSGLNEVVKIDSGESPNTNASGGSIVYERQLIRVAPVPDQDYTADVTWKRQPPGLSEDNSVPEIPVSNVLVYRAVGELVAEDRNSAGTAGLWFARADQALAVAKGAQKAYAGGIRPKRGNWTSAHGIHDRWNRRS